jgi:hypothetical protein
MPANTDSENSRAGQAGSDPTDFRLAALRNGFHPRLNNCKVATGKGWPKSPVDEAEIRSWGRSLFDSTGMMVDGDLAVIDIDVDEAPFFAQLRAGLEEKFPELSRALVRGTTSTVKIALIARVEQPFRRIASWRLYRGPYDNPTALHQVECFGSKSVRQFGVAGAHKREHGVVTSRYEFRDGRSPATVPRSELPVLPKAAFNLACTLFNTMAREAGLAIYEEPKSIGESGRFAYTLTPDMTFENERGSYKLDELEVERFIAVREGRDFRVTSSFLKDGGTNFTKCIVGYSHRYRSVCIHNFETATTHLPAECKPPSREDFAVLIAQYQSKGKPT